MKNTNFTLVKSLLGLTVSALFVLLTVADLQAQCTLACNSAVNISVAAMPADPNSCDVEINADMILENYDDALANCAGGVEANFNLIIMDGPAVIAEGPSALLVPGEDYELNETYQVKVEAADNQCWGTIVIEDKAAPIILTCPDAAIDCTQDLDDEALVPTPTAQDNCSGVTVELIDESTNTADQCGVGVVITQSFIATDGEGNTSAPCTRQITITQTGGVDFPEDIVFSCVDAGQFSNISAVAPLTCTGLMSSAQFAGALDATAAPAACLATTGAGVPNIAEGDFCNFAVGNDDDVLDVCVSAASAFKIIRTFTVFDWCSNSVVTFNDLNGNGVQDDADEAQEGEDFNGDGDTDDIVAEEDNIQIIKVLDVTPPTISLPAGANLTLSAGQPATSTQACRSRSLLPIPITSDACSNTVTYQVFTPVGQANIFNGSPQIPAPGLPIGETEITYVATDGCGNTAELTVLFNIVDNITPTPVCDEITQISIGGSGTATILAETFDDGSNDNCGVDFFQVRRMTDNCAIAGNTVFGPSVQFCCADIGTTQQVIFRVFDVAGNFNDCMVDVLVDDPLPPTLVTGLAPATITCDEFFANIQPALDIAMQQGNNAPAILDQFGTPVFNDNCAVTATPGFSVNVNSCGEGTITRTVTTVDENGNVGPSVVQTISVVTENDWQILFPADIDLVCEPGMDELEGEDLGEPVVFDDDCEMIAISTEAQTFNAVEDACYKIIRTFTAINWCVFDGDNLDDDILVSTRRFMDGTDGVVVYTQEIRVSDDVAPVITNPGTLDFVIDGSTDPDGDCDRNISLPALNVSDCSESVTVITSVDGLGAGSNFTDVGIGTYTVNVTAFDGCGNQATTQYTFVVRDGKAPTPYCVGGLVAELMPVDGNGDGQPESGMLELWANDFDAGSFDNCTAQENLKFFATNGVDNFALATTNINFDCTNVGLNDIFMYVQDEAGNVDYCQVTIEIESVDNVCDDSENESPEVAGAVQTPNDAAMEGVVIEVNSGTANMTDTDATGGYALNVDAGSDVSVIPSYESAYDEGVTTFDLLLIRRHILQTEILDNPYKRIAADANNSGTISSADLVTLRAVILGMSSTFPNNTSWVFVDANYDFPTDWTLTDGYPAVVNINNIAADATADFTAIKVGDVNMSWTNFTDGGEERTGNAFRIRTEDAELQAGETHTVTFHTENLETLGYQFTLNFLDTEVTEINGKAENFAQFADAITTSETEKTTDGQLFSVTFRALSDLRLSEALTLTSSITKAEAYNADGEVMPVDLIFDNSPASDFTLYQNTPNPVLDGSTEIAFDLPQAAAAVITVRDITGKVIAVKSGEFAQGKNTINFTNINTAGVLTYTLQSADFTAVRKMIVH